MATVSGLEGKSVEELNQLIAELDKRIASMPEEHMRQNYMNMKAQAQEQLKTQQPYEKMGDLSNSLLDPNSPFYQEYAKYLQKTSPQMGVNSLLAPLMAGGMSYAGGQNIVAEKQKQFAGQRQDKINTGVQGFALGNIGTGASLLGQQGNLGLGIAQLNEQKRQYNDQNSGWNQFFGMLGQVTGFVPGLFGGGGGASGYGGYTTGGASSQQTTAGYRG